MTDKNKVQKIYCAITNDNGIEGIPFVVTEAGQMPLIATDNLPPDMMLAAQLIADGGGVKVTICEFSVRREIKVINPTRSGQH